jgi:hypothetical protein
MTDVTTRQVAQESTRRERLWPAALTGAGWAAAWMAGTITAFAGGEGFDPYGASPESIVSYVREYESQLVVGLMLMSLSAFFMLWFTGCMRTRIRSLGGDSAEHLSGLVLIGGGTLATIQLAIAGALGAASYTADIEAFEATAALMLLAWGGLLGVVRIGLAVWFAAVAIASIRHRALPRWLGWPAAVLAVAFFLMPDASIAVIVSFLWMLVASVTLTLLGRTVRPRG